MVPVALWLFAIALWQKYHHNMTCEKTLRYSRILLLMFSLFTVFFIIASIPTGLLSSPNMLVQGNLSSSFHYYWFQDLTLAGQQPQAQLFYLPIWCYHLIMLFWSAWLAFKLVEWIPWALKIIQIENIRKITGSEST